MIDPLRREETVDLRAEPLGPGWLRKGPTLPEAEEIAGPGVWRTGARLMFREALVAAIDGAREIALVCSFLLADERLAEAMLRAAGRGVRVYVLTASEQRIGKVVREDEAFEQRMADEHKKLLDRLAGKVLLRSAEHIHAKFLVVDPQDASLARAFLSTANFNKALETSMELGVALDAAGATALAACFRWAFWCEARHELRGPNRLRDAGKPPAEPARPEAGAVCTTLSDRADLRDRVLGLIRGARREILVASYGVDAEHPAVLALVEAARRGVAVTVLTRPRPVMASALAVLAAAGVSIVAHDKLHAKAISADGQVLVMTANLEPRGLDGSFEVGAILPTAMARTVESVLRSWASSFPWAYRADAKRGEHFGEFCPAGASPKDAVVKVIAEQQEKLSAVIAVDALRLADAPAPKLVPSPRPGEVPRLARFTWEVRPPALPKGATERFREIEREELDKGGKPRKVIDRVPYDPPWYEHAGQRYVVLKRLDDAGKARSAADERGAVVVIG